MNITSCQNHRMPKNVRFYTWGCSFDPTDVNVCVIAAGISLKSILKVEYFTSAMVNVMQNVPDIEVHTLLMNQKYVTLALVYSSVGLL